MGRTMLTGQGSKKGWAAAHGVTAHGAALVRPTVGGNPAVPSGFLQNPTFKLPDCPTAPLPDGTDFVPLGIFGYAPNHFAILGLRCRYITDDATAELVARLAKLRGISKQAAPKSPVRTELDRATAVIPLRGRFAGLRIAHPLPPSTGDLADKEFFDELSGEGNADRNSAKAGIQPR